jgi:hypothetical protein
MKRITTTLSHNTGVSLALALAAAAALWTFAQDKGRGEAQNNELRSRVERLEGQQTVQAGMAAATTSRLTVLEAKLDLVLDRLGIKAPSRKE